MSIVRNCDAEECLPRIIDSAAVPLWSQAQIRKSPRTKSNLLNDLAVLSSCADPYPPLLSIHLCKGAWRMICESLRTPWDLLLLQYSGVECGYEASLVRFSSDYELPGKAKLPLDIVRAGEWFRKEHLTASIRLVLTLCIISPQLVNMWNRSEMIQNGDCWSRSHLRGLSDKKCSRILERRSCVESP